MRARSRGTDSARLGASVYRFAVRNRRHTSGTTDRLSRILKRQASSPALPAGGDRGEGTSFTDCRRHPRWHAYTASWLGDSLYLGPDFIEKLGRKVCAVRPLDGVGLRIQPHPPEEHEIFERLEDLAVQLLREVDIFDDTVAENDAKCLRFADRDTRNVQEHRADRQSTPHRCRAQLAGREPVPTHIRQTCEVSAVSVVACQRALPHHAGQRRQAFPLFMGSVGKPETTVPVLSPGNEFPG
jgi:hypothetical protein